MQKKIKYENDIHWPVCLATQGKNRDIPWISRISHQGQRKRKINNDSIFRFKQSVAAAQARTCKNLCAALSVHAGCECAMTRLTESLKNGWWL